MQDGACIHGTIGSTAAVHRTGDGTVFRCDGTGAIGKGASEVVVQVAVGIRILLGSKISVCAGDTTIRARRCMRALVRRRGIRT